MIRGARACLRPSHHHTRPPRGQIRHAKCMILTGAHSRAFLMLYGRGAAGHVHRAAMVLQLLSGAQNIHAIDPHPRKPCCIPSTAHNYSCACLPSAAARARQTASTDTRARRFSGAESVELAPPSAAAPLTSVSLLTKFISIVTTIAHLPMNQPPHATYGWRPGGGLSSARRA